MNIETEQLAALFNALAHPIRTRIVCGLSCKDECNVNKMSEILGVSQPTVSQHLTVLKAAGIIEGYRKGTQICYRLISEEVRFLIKNLNVTVKS